MQVRDDISEKADEANEWMNDYSEQNSENEKIEAKSNCLLSQNGAWYESGMCEFIRLHFSIPANMRFHYSFLLCLGEHFKCKVS